MKRFFVVFATFFFSMFITASIFSYYAFAKHAIETNGFLGGSPVFNNLSDFPLFCILSFTPFFIIAALICTLLSKNPRRVNLILIAIVYIGFWLFASTFAAAGSAVDYGNTWSMVGIFNYFILRNYLYGAPLLLIGLFLNKPLRNY